MATAPRVGEILDGKYRILRKLGEGGMGAVYAGEHLRVEKVVAIKVLHAAAGEVAEMADRFDREARAAGKIGNEHIVEVYDLGLTPSGERYIVMEYLEGESLRARLGRSKRLTVSEITGIVIQMLDGLAAAHEAGVIHRDLKPDNVYLTRGRRGYVDFVKVLDFGISKFSDGEGSTTKTGTVLGSPNYMSPEHIRSSNEVDATSDLYGVGVILFEAVTGQVPRKGANFAELLFKVAYEPFPDPRIHVPELPAAFCDVIKKACAAERAARYQNADEMADALAQFAPAPDAQALRASQRGTAPRRTAPSAVQISQSREPSVPDGDEARTIAIISEPDLSMQNGTAVISPMPSGSNPAFNGSPLPSFGFGSQPGFGAQPGFGSQPSFHSQPGFGSPPRLPQAPSSNPGISSPALGVPPQFPQGAPNLQGAGLPVPTPMPHHGNASTPGFGSQPNFASASQATFAGAVGDARAPQPRRSGVVWVGIGALMLAGLAGGTYAAFSMRASSTPPAAQQPVAQQPVAQQPNTTQSDATTLPTTTAQAQPSQAPTVIELTEEPSAQDSSTVDAEPTASAKARVPIRTMPTIKKTHDPGF